MPPHMLRTDERFGLVVALALHAAVFAALLLRPRETPPPAPQRVAVTISDEVGLTDTAPRPAARPAPDIAPTRGEAQPAPTLLAAAPSPAPRPAPARGSAPATRPIANPPRAEAAARAHAPSAPKSPAPAGASRIGSNFLKGVAGTNAGDAHTPPAAAIGPEVRASLGSAIARQLKPRWQAPQGADAELLVTVLAWDLNLDGSLAAGPRVVGQSGVTETNRAQAARHAEQAVRAVQLAAPFELPPRYYAAWRHVAAFRFDKRLAQ